MYVPGAAIASAACGNRDEELADVLTAISVVSRRLARKLRLLAAQEKSGKGDVTHGEDEGTGGGT